MRCERPDWAGRTVVCIASGPSLTKEDCDKVRASGHTTIVTNNTFRLCPWADVLFGMDSRWWAQYGKDVAEFKGRKVSTSASVGRYGVESTYGAGWFNGFGNSGTCAISFAMAAGARRIILLGYDCQKASKAHWHEDHPAPLTNAKSIKNWPRQFEQVSRHTRARGIEVLNASRETALGCFPRAVLEDVL